MTFEDWEDIHKYSPNIDQSEDDEKETVKDISQLILLLKVWATIQGYVNSQSYW